MTENNKTDLRPQSPISWYPGHMHKTKKEIKENLKYVDLVYELVDARIPSSSKIEDIDDLIKKKLKIIIITKKDLCDIKITNQWLDYYKGSGQNVVLIDLNNNSDYKKLINLSKKMTSKIIDARKQKGIINEQIKILVTGVPNVGKSTLINKLAKKNVAKVENKPGATTHLNWLKTNYNFLLLDTPGILWPKIKSETQALNLAAFNCIKTNVVDVVEVGKYILNYLIENYPNILLKTYKLNNLNSIEKEISENFNFIEHGEIILEKLYERIYLDLISTKIKGVTFDQFR